MNTEQLKEKISELTGSCPCGSGKMYFECCGTDEAEAIAKEKCPCGSGKTVADCCMKNPKAHKNL